MISRIEHSLNLMRYIALLCSLCWLSGCHSFSESSKSSEPIRPAPLEVIQQGSSRILGLSDLRSVADSDQISLFDPVYGQQKSYAGFWFTNMINGLEIRTQEIKSIEFHCVDDYLSILSCEHGALEASSRAFLAFAETTPAKNHLREFAPLPNKSENAAPFYLVWTTAEGEAPDPSAPETPWPYQVNKIVFRSTDQP